jgi:hypothetical protein
MSSRFLDCEPGPLIRTFDEIPVLPRLIEPHNRIIGVARAFGLKDMPDTVEAYIRLSQRSRSETGQQIGVTSDNPVTLPVAEIEIDDRNVRSVGQEVAAGSLMSWTLYNNRVVRVPWTKANLDNPEEFFSGANEEGQVRFQRVLPQEAYLMLTQTYVTQLQGIQDRMTSDLRNMFRFLSDSGFNPNPL